ncbi:hypothetical protein EYC84_000220 [Monilinia fructicola]|uniref:ATPase synthesis protein 25 n=1 Tax=Monilinia fructicola TaxID=38448 RepID=A0A5M9JMU4_MONFR|nr:hypothetical protein EYC84_000220 [Monilinia fructicola]
MDKDARTWALAIDKGIQLCRAGGISYHCHQLTKMVVSQAIRAAGCASCRLSLLRNATSLPTRILPASGRFHATKIPRRQIRFSSHSRIGELDETSMRADTLESRGFLNENEADGEEVKTESSQYEAVLKGQEPLNEIKADEEIGTSVSAVPWYLQVETPQTTPKALSERQKIPDLPELPPPILQPMLQHISVDLGLDDLTLLDLRKLDPPPALGANLIMLIGTARSEKHLHVSADRLCRWLRSTYKLRPSADGLLGRNELKLKLRRKSRRAKLLGSAADDNGDDGIRTGWVCVDIGVVDSPDMHVNAVPEGDGFVGFGRRTDGVRVVVQMLTEEKRLEIDLEKLWGGILRRSGQSEIEAEDGKLEVVEDAEFEVEEPTPRSNFQSSQNTAGLAMKPRGFQIPQTRQFHTSVRRRIDAPMDQQPNANQLDWQYFLLYQLRTYLENVSREEAMAYLGQGYLPGDTPFLKCFQDAVIGVRQTNQPASFKWDYVFWLFYYAQDIGHPWFKTINLIKLFKIFEKEKFDDSDISDEYYHRIIRTILEPARGAISDKSHAPARFNSRFALKVIQTMFRRGHKILTEEMFVTLQEATERISDLDILTVHPKATINDSFGIPTKAMTPIQRRIHTLMMNLELPSFSDESRWRLMQLYARNGHWIAFWDIWRLPLRQSKPQSAAMYAYMFHEIAETGHQKGCMKVLRTWIEDVDREDPAVRLEGDLAEAVKACLLVADPHVEQEVIQDPEKPGEWSSLWRRCHGGDQKWKDMVEDMVAKYEQSNGQSDAVELGDAAMAIEQEFN